MAAAKIYVVRNQRDQFLSKQNEWVSGSERHALFRSAHRDVAVNQLFEATLRDFDVRAEVVACRADSRGDPLLDTVSPQAEAGAEDAAEQLDSGEEEGAQPG